MDHVFHRHTQSQLPIAVKGDGAYVIDRNGKHYLDACGGAAVSCLGHSHPEVVAAIKSQLDAIPYAHTAFFSNEPSEQLADFLVARAPRGLERVYFVSGGSEAIESALKLARQYFLEKGQPQRKHFIARYQSYHGNTLGALAVGGNQWRKQPYEPLLAECHHISPCYAYRGRLEHETEQVYGQRVADELEAKIQGLGEDSVLAFVAEPVVGATLGAVPAVPGYFKRVREICDHYGVLLILDEVMSGMGRTGSLFAAEQEDIIPDMVAFAKALGAGYQPIGALLVQREIYASIESGTGFFQNGHTYMGHPTACAAALATQRVIERDGLLQNVRDKGEALFGALHQEFSQHPYVGDIRGRGLLLGLELVADRETKTPFAVDTQIHSRVKNNAMEKGLMCYPMSGTIDGKSGHHILLAPPYILQDQQIDEIVSKLSAAIKISLEKINRE